MSNATFSISGLTLSPAAMLRHFLFAAFLLFSAHLSVLHAQATLSIQGILKKTNGVAVDDGTYNMTFKLYATETGGTAIWTEVQSGVEVSSGIYSAVLGNTTALAVSFNQIYYLGVTIGSAELTPRIQLTSAPYALALIGNTNKFPSSGIVKADSIVVNGGVLARGGAPGLNGVNRNGFAFSGNSGDKDSGLFSTIDGKVSLYANNTEVLAATPGNVEVIGSVSANNLALSSGGTVSYNGLSDWRLIDVDNFETSNEGWVCYTDYYTNTLAATPQRFEIGAPVNSGYVLRPTGNSGNAFRKTLNLTGVPHTQVKVIFTAYFFNSVDNGEGVYGAFSSVATPVQNYTNIGETIIGCHAMMPYGGAGEVNSQLESGPEGKNWTRRMEMVVRNSNDTIYVILDSTMTEAIDNENYGIGNIEIWVK